MSAGRRRRIRLLLPLAAALLCFAGLEVTLRVREAARGRPGFDRTTGHAWEADGDSLLHVRSQNRRLVYELRPNASVHVPSLGRTIRTNAAGFRDRDFVQPKPPGSTRILALGDSITFGWELPVEATYPKLLEAALGERGRAAEVFNMGVGGYNTLQEVEVAKTRGIFYDPDLLMIGYVLNDEQVGMDAGLWEHFSRSASRAYDFLRLRLLRLRHRLGRGPTAAAFAELAELVQLAPGSRVPVLVVVFPVLETLEDGSYPHLHHHGRVRELAREHGFLVLDLLEPFRAAGLESLRVSLGDRVHPNARGHSIAAQAILAFLERNAGQLGL